jgi:hypothetical protein
MGEESGCGSGLARALGDAADGHGPHGRDTSRNNATIWILELFSVKAASAAHEYG